MLEETHAPAVCSQWSRSTGAGPPCENASPVGALLPWEDTMRHPTSVLSLLVAFAGPSRAPSAVPLAISLSPSTIAGGNPATGTILLSSPAGNSGVTVTLTAPPGITIDPGANAVSGGAQGSTRIGVPAGATSVTFRVLTSPVAAVQQALISGTSGNTTATATLTLNPASVRTVSLSPATVTGGATATLTMTLDAPLASGLVVTLNAAIASTDGSVQQLGAPLAVSLPFTVQAAPGQTSITQPAVTVPVFVNQSVTIAAAVSPASTPLVPRGSASALLTVLAPVVSAVQLSPAALTGGATATGTAVLTGKAPGKGLTFAVSSTDTSAVVPQILAIPGGSDRASFPISTKPVAITASAAIRAVSTSTLSTTLPFIEQAATVGATLTIQPPVVRAVSVSPSSVFGGTTTTGTVALTGPAPALGFSLRIASSSASAVVAANATVSAGSDHLSFPIVARLTTTPSVTATITASGQPTSSSTISSTTDGTSNTIIVGESTTGPSATLAISSQVLGALTVPDSARGSSGFTILLTLASGVPTPVTVTLATNHPELLGLPAVASVSPNLVSKVLVTTKPVSARLAGVTITATAGSSVIGKTMVLTP